MCGIVGYIGKNYSRSFVLEGLSRLEYRGYDSAGFACIDPKDKRLFYHKAAGRLVNLVAKCDKSLIDGHFDLVQIVTVDTCAPVLPLVTQFDRVRAAQFLVTHDSEDGQVHLGKYLSPRAFCLM